MKKNFIFLLESRSAVTRSKRRRATCVRGRD